MNLSGAVRRRCTAAVWLAAADRVSRLTRAFAEAAQCAGVAS